MKIIGWGHVYVVYIYICLCFSLSMFLSPLSVLFLLLGLLTRRSSAFS